MSNVINTERARLTWLNVHIDFVQSDYFEGMRTMTRWVDWRARNSLAKPKPPSFPARLRDVLPTTLADAQHLVRETTVDATVCATDLETYAAQLPAWKVEAEKLRFSVHGAHITVAGDVH